MKILTKKFLQKIVIKTYVANFMHFQDEMVHLFIGLTKHKKLKLISICLKNEIF